MAEASVQGILGSEPHRASVETENELVAETVATLALSLTRSLGPVRIKALVSRFGGAVAALSASEGELRSCIGRSIKLDDDVHLRATREFERARRAGLEVVPLSDPRYPSLLRAIHDPPSVLYVRGDVRQLASLNVPAVRSVAIVGTRRATEHARALSKRLAGDLSSVGVVIVSGLARGIDTVAHQAAVEAGGLSVAVLGCGADQIYPSENRALADTLLVLSEYRVGTPPAAHNFPARNRIVAGLSQGVVVVEGDLDSGSMITARIALDEGRTVFAVPGLAGSSHAAGPHALLREGARLTESAQDVFEEFAWSAARSTLEAPTRAGVVRIDAVQPQPTQAQQLRPVQFRPVQPRSIQTEPIQPEPVQLSVEEGAVLKAIEGAALLDDLVAATQLAVGVVLASLVVLGLHGLVRELPGGRFVREGIS